MKDVKLFLEDVVALCQMHDLALTTSEHDHFQVWDYEDVGYHYSHRLLKSEDKTRGKLYI